VDGHKINLPSLQGIVVLNIPRYNCSFTYIHSLLDLVNNAFTDVYFMIH